jgi:hypothetical protein
MTRSKMKTLFIVARKNRAHLVSIISITAILDLTTVNVKTKSSLQRHQRLGSKDCYGGA